MSHMPVNLQCKRRVALQLWANKQEPNEKSVIALTSWPLGLAVDHKWLKPFLLAHIAYAYRKLEGLRLKKE